MLSAQDDPILQAELLALLEADDYVRAEHSLAHFIKAAWPILEPGKRYLHNWHIDAISEHLEAVHLGEIKKLIINMPPRYMKSIAVTVCFPVWTWLQDPTKRFMTASYSASLSIKHNGDRRTLITSPWFQKAWSGLFTLSEDQNQKSEFSNEHRGHMIATSVGGTTIGRGADCLIADDPLNPMQAASDTERDKANEWYDLSFSTRLDNKKTGSQIVVMQRLHEKDLTGHLMAKGGWTQLSLPALAPTKTTVVFPITKREVVREQGDPLHPEREGIKEITERKTELGSAGFNSQYQQDPRPIDGGFFKRSWWKRYSETPLQFIRKVMFIDCAEEPGVTNDYTVIATWMQTTTGYYLVDLWRNKVAFPELQNAVKDIYVQQSAAAVVIEKKSAGTQLLQNLRATTTLPVIAYEPKGRSKVVRAAGAQPTVEAGNCFLPQNRSWVELFISEHEKFPNGENDDQVDTTSMMAEHFRMNSLAQPRIRTL